MRTNVESVVIDQRVNDDPHLWLEATHDPAALAWSAERSAATRAALTASPIYPALLAELNDTLAAHATIPSVFFIGAHLARFRRDSANPHGILEIADAELKAWRTALDIGALRATEGRNYSIRAEMLAKTVLPGTDLCLVPLSVDGADEVELREFDLARGAFVAGGFHAPASQADAAWLDQDRMVIVHTLGDAPRAASGRGASAFLWTRGTPVEHAEPLTSITPSESALLLTGIGSGTERCVLATCLHDYSSISFAIIDYDANVRDVTLPRRLKGFPPLAATATHFLVQFTEAADIDGATHPAESLIAYDVRPATPEAERASLVRSFEDGEFANDFIYGFAGTRDAFHFVTDRHTQQRILTARPAGDGWQVEELLAAAPGVALKIGMLDSWADKSGDGLLVHQTGFLLPNRIDLIRGGETRAIAAEPAAFTGDYEVAVRSAVSRDGTQIDYFLLAPKGRTGPVPALLTGYGAFGVSMAPNYFSAQMGGRSLKLWLDRGGALALPLARGGGERGAAWHAAAVRANKQKSFDDFIAAAEDMIAAGITTPARFGVFGSSHGGLLAGVLGTQRPDLFAAVVSDAPVLDMLRYTKMGIGAGLITEYGDPGDPAEAAALTAYSPYHNLRAGQVYPPILVTVSTADNRVDPGHSRKFAARAEEVSAPVQLLELAEGGHAMSDPTTNPELMAMRMTFLIDALMPKTA